MIKVYLLKSKGGLELQVACTPFGVLLYPADADISMVFKFGWKQLAKHSLQTSFKLWKGDRYRIIGVKMIKGCNEK